MAERFLIKEIPILESVPVQENTQKKIKRNENLKKIKEKSIIKNKKMRTTSRHNLKMRSLKFESEYRKERENRIRLRREAKAQGGYYKEPGNKVIFAIRLKGINKLAPKPKMILRLFRLRQIHNGVFIKVNKATEEMLKVVQTFITYGYPSLSMIRKLVYKRGYGKVGRRGSSQRIRLTTNDIIKKNLCKYGIEGMEDIVHEIYTCGPYFKEVTNFLWPFKLTSPRKGFVCKRHGFNEPLGGDWGNREELVNKLLLRMT